MISSDSRKDKLIRAMSKAGYALDRLESTDEWLRFFTPGCGTVAFDGWEELEEWLNGVVFDDPDISDEVERLLNGEASA